MLEKSISCRTFGSKQRIKVSFIAFFLLFNHFFLSFNNYFVSSVNRNPNKHLQCTTHTMASFIVSVTTLYSPFSLAFSIYSLTRARAIYVSIASSIASMIHAILNRFLLSRAFFFRHKLQQYKYENCTFAFALASFCDSSTWSGYKHCFIWSSGGGESVRKMHFDC